MKITLPERKVNPAVAPAGALWPNGEFTIGYSPGGCFEQELSVSEYLDRVLSPLGLSHPSNSHSDLLEEKAKRGQKGLTSHGKRVLRNSVWRLQRLYGKKSLAFCTLTLPGCEFETAWDINSDWSRIVRVFFQKLGRHMEAAGLPKHYVSVTEIQPERSAGVEFPVLHLHFVIVTRYKHERSFRMAPGELRWIWASVVGPYFPDQEFWGAVENMQVIKRDAAAYMAKYFSKAQPPSIPVNDPERGWHFPTAWYNVSLSLRQWVQSNIRKDSRMLELIESAIRAGGGEDCFYYCHGMNIDGMPGPGPHAYVGKLMPDLHKDLIEIWRAEVFSSGLVV
jgi:hypothetical protein